MGYTNAKKLRAVSRKKGKLTLHPTGWHYLFLLLKRLGWKRLTYRIFSQPRVGCWVKRNGHTVDAKLIRSKPMTIKLDVGLQRKAREP